MEAEKVASAAPVNDNPVTSSVDAKVDPTVDSSPQAPFAGAPNEEPVLMQEFYRYFGASLAGLPDAEEVNPAEFSFSSTVFDESDDGDGFGDFSPPKTAPPVAVDKPSLVEMNAAVNRIKR